MSDGITNATTAIKEPTVTPATDLPELEEPQDGWTEEQKIAYIKRGLALNDRLGVESETCSKRETMVAFRVGQVLHHELKVRGTEAAVGDWAKTNGIKWTRGREALRLYWRCDTPEKRAELKNLTIKQARREYQVRYASFEKNRYKKVKPAGPVVDQLQDALVKLMTILEAATADDWHKAEDLIGTVSAQIADVMGKLSEVKQNLDAIVPVGQKPEPEKSKGDRKATAAETPEKTPRRRSKVGDDQA